MNELTFLDLVVLKKIDPESSVEKFGSTINTSFFETANLVGTIKIKGYIDIEPSLGGMSKIALTEAGQAILLMAEKKATEPIEPLDNAIIHALAGGANTLESLQSALNVRSGDLSYHINKLVAQGFMDYSIRSAKVYFTLTEQGFNSTGGMRMQQAPGAQQAPQGQQPMRPQQQPASQPWAVPQSKFTPSMAAAPRQSEEKPWQQEGPSAPPWVQQQKEKGDVAHLLKDEHQPESKQQPAQQKMEPKPLSPDEQKRQEKNRRMLSKLEYYISEYGLWIILVLIVVLVFLVAMYFMVAAGGALPSA
jgi:hypothetical protein